MNLFNKIFGNKTSTTYDYSFLKQYTVEDQEKLDLDMDKTAKRAAIYMYDEYMQEKRRYLSKFGNLDYFLNLAIIPPFASVITVYPGQKSRHSDGKYEKMVMELYQGLISTNQT